MFDWPHIRKHVLNHKPVNSPCDTELTEIGARAKLYDQPILAIGFSKWWSGAGRVTVERCVTWGRSMLKLRSSTRLATAAALAGLAALAPAYAEPGATPTPTARVHATYHITWNGLDLGDFTWDSSISGGQYKAVTNAKVSALFGAYTWEGATRSSGAYAAGAPHPAAYKFKFTATDKNGRVDMTFANNRVASLSSDPPDKGNGIPLTPANLENVLDPLSAIMAMSSPGTGSVENTNPCQRRLSVFDGKQRFDLALSFKKKTHLENAAGAKYVYVCKIQYVPIAGMKMNTETKYMASTDGIEVWLAPVPFANAFVPVNVVIPTWAGSAEITSSKVQIDVPGRGQLALTAK